MDPPPENPRRPSRKHLVLALVGLVVVALALDYFLYPVWAPSSGRSFNRGENGLWLRYWWSTGERTGPDLDRLARELTAEQIRYAYFHARDVTASGSLRYHYPEAAQRLVRALHASAPGVKVLAWVYAGNARAHGPVNLARPAVRRKMVAEARWLVTVCGFDGVQWDYEICPSGDAGFLGLLRETRAALPRGALVSVAAPLWMPQALEAVGGGWSEAYFTQVAAQCDQIAVMCYDSGVMLPRAYVRLVAEQARHVSRAVAAASGTCRVLLGLPTYGPGGGSHNPVAENLHLGLLGVREGLASAGRDASACAGVALFADYTTDAAEWATYDRLWLR